MSGVCVCTYGVMSLNSELKQQRIHQWCVDQIDTNLKSNRKTVVNAVDAEDMLGTVHFLLRPQHHWHWTKKNALTPNNIRILFCSPFPRAELWCALKCFSIPFSSNSVQSSVSQCWVGRRDWTKRYTNITSVTFSLASTMLWTVFLLAVGKQSITCF